MKTASKLVTVLLLSGLCMSIASADYRYTKSNLCVWDACSVQTCDVTEYEAQLTTTTTTHSADEVFAALQQYLKDNWQDFYVEWLDNVVWWVCTIPPYVTSTTTNMIPDPTETCTRSDPICWNSIVEDGEECDKWVETNGQDGVWCSTDCKLRPEFDVSVYDPVPCDQHFKWWAKLDTWDYENVQMYLEVQCEDGWEYVSLDPLLDDNGEYTALLNYIDPSASNYLMWECNVRYGWYYQWIEVRKTAVVTLEWVCDNWATTDADSDSLENRADGDTQWSWGRKRFWWWGSVSNWSNNAWYSPRTTGGLTIIHDDGSVTTTAKIEWPPASPETPSQELFHMAPPISLGPNRSMTAPHKLESTGGGYRHRF